MSIKLKQPTMRLATLFFLFFGKSSDVVEWYFWVVFQCFYLEKCSLRKNVKVSD